MSVTLDLQTRVSVGFRLTDLYPTEFARALRAAWKHPKGDSTIGAMLDPAAEAPNWVPTGLVRGVKIAHGVVVGGYVLKDDGELTTVWSSLRGVGDELLLDAVLHGARRLDCFDGYLPEYYGRAGFVEVRREPNWTPGGPDVVFMELR